MGVYGICLGAAALYFLSRITGREVEILKSVTRVCNLKDLAQLESKSLPLIIAVSGSVGSETPIKCEHSGILGVILEETRQQYFLKRNWMFSWVQDTALMQPITKEVPWHLDDGTGRVNVAVPLDAIRFLLTVGSEVYEKSEPSSLVRRTLDYLQGLKMLGVRRFEHVLPIGTRLTLVGEAIKDGMGNVGIRKPEIGPFYVSAIPLDQLICKLGKWSRRFKYASIGLTVVGFIMISKPVIESILKICRQRLLLKRVRDAEAINRLEPVNRELERQHESISDSRNRDDQVLDLRQHESSSDSRNRDDQVLDLRQHESISDSRNRDDQLLDLRQHESSSDSRNRDDQVLDLRQHESISDSRNRDDQVLDLCGICFEEECDTAFFRCGHMCCCITCFSKLESKICPLCREPLIGLEE